MRTVFTTMGTVVTLVTHGATSKAIEDVQEVFTQIDQQFSLYRDDSELSRIAAGHLALADSSTGLRDAYAAALDWRSRTGGAFTAHRPDGVIDLSGIVKAIAIDRAGALLDTAGVAEWSLNCGGDILVRTMTQSEPAIIGIADPARPGELATALALLGGRRAIATSGVSERGEHIWGQRGAIAQVTVIANDIITADVLATAILAGDEETLDLVTRTEDCDVLLVEDDGSVRATPRVHLAGARSILAP
jgi:FAD:protein FMN transferase